MTPEHDEALRLALTEAEALLAEVHVRDCGAHYCRYCSARSPEWEHGPYCPYVESQEASTRAQHLRARIRALLHAHEGRPTCGTCRHWRDGNGNKPEVYREYARCNCDGPTSDLETNREYFCADHQPAPPAQPEGEGEQHGTTTDAQLDAIDYRYDEADALRAERRKKGMTNG